VKPVAWPVKNGKSSVAHPAWCAFSSSRTSSGPRSKKPRTGYDDLASITELLADKTPATPNVGLSTAWAPWGCMPPSDRLVSAWRIA
jgi:hypothetical protein